MFYWMFLDVFKSLDNCSLFSIMLQSMFLKLAFWKRLPNWIWRVWGFHPSLKFNWSYPGMFFKTDHPEESAVWPWSLQYFKHCHAFKIQLGSLAKCKGPTKKPLTVKVISYRQRSQRPLALPLYDQKVIFLNSFK